jgi:hypothetical protein
MGTAVQLHREVTVLLYTGSYYVVQAGFKLNPASPSQVVELQAITTMSTIGINFYCSIAQYNNYC